jgi:hypothetical protein
VRIWVAQVDPGAVRATNDVDILIHPENLELVKIAMAENGYHYRKAAGIDMFLEGKDDSVRFAIRVVFANRMVKPDDYEPNPDVEPSVYGAAIPGELDFFVLWRGGLGLRDAGMRVWVRWRL